MTILCGVDFSESGEPALRVATALCRRLDDSLLLAHAVDVSGYAMLPDMASYASSFEEKSREVLQSELNKRAAALRAEGIPTEAQLLTGPADGALGHLADTVQPRLVITGRHGARGLKRLLLGSVSESLMRTCRHPVLVVGSEQTGLLSWADTPSRPLRLLMAVDDTPATSAALGWLKLLRGRVPVDVTFVHFYYPPEQHRRLGMQPPDAPDGDGEVVRALHRDLSARIGELPGEGGMQLRVYANWVSVAERLGHEVKNVGADLLVLGHHERTLWERLSENSVVEQTLREVDIPIVCVPGEARRPGGVPDMREVVAATDLSEGGNHAIPYAYALLRGGGGTVQLCYVASKESDVADAEAKLRALVPRDAALYGITTEVEVVVNKGVAAGIAQLAERVGADAICLGTNGRGRLAQALLGSTTAELGASTRKPLFLVR